ncbi:MAG TPA: alpha/beta fold hydrolase [Gaiella sp.]|jgi:pimeloyl-ACP methyl ester carboxylesterase
MERLVLVHGSVTGGRATWSAQRHGLAERFDLVVLERPGFPLNPSTERVDFEVQAVWLVEQLHDGDHLVGHSYGGVVSLLAAARAPERVTSLTLLEPPCTRVARGHPAADRFAREGADWWAHGPTDDPEAFLRGFLEKVGSSYVLPTPLPAEVEHGARALIAERGPWEADIPLDVVARAGVPSLVVSGAHHAAFDAICDVLERELSAERLVLPGFGHTPQRHPDFNDALAAFVERAAAAQADPAA